MTKVANETGRSAGYSLWLGTESSLQDFISAEEGILAQVKAGSKPEMALEDDEDKPSRLLNVSEGVAVITIHGSLTNKDSWWNSWFGLISYNEIRAALVQAVTDETVSQILLDISSGGGAVAGVSDTANLIKEVNKVKQVTTFSDGAMASAAYWLGSSAGRIKASNTAIIGSIGVILHHTEFSKMRAEAGVKDTMLRSGTHKALINPFEALTEVAKAEAQSQLDHLYQVFVQGVAENLGASYPDVDTRMGQGREFVGSQARDVGLVDEITSFDKLLGELVEKAKVATGDDNNNLFMESETMTKKVLSAADIAAAVAAGADPKQFETLTAEQVAVTAAVTSAGEAMASADVALAGAKDLLTKAEGALVGVPEGDSIDAAQAAIDDATKLVADVTVQHEAATKSAALVAEATDETSAQAALAPVTEASTKAADILAAASPEEPEISPEPEVDKGAMAELRTQLAASQKSVIELNVEVSQLTASNKLMTDSQEGLLQIARDSANKMQVALGASITDLSAISGAELLTVHANASADFKKNFKVGGVAATAVEDLRGRETAAKGSSSRNRAAVAATVIK